MKNLKILTIISICVGIMGLTIGYSALHTSLAISNNASAVSANWSIKFANISNVTSGNAINIKTDNNSNTELIFDMQFNNIGDSITYNFDLVNDGNIDAKLSTLPTLTNIPSNYTYTINYLDGTSIKENDTLPSGTTKSLKLTITCNSLDNNIPQEINSKLVMLYIQE